MTSIKGGRRTPLCSDSCPRILDISFLLGLDSKLNYSQWKKKIINSVTLTSVMARNFSFSQIEVLKGIKMKLRIKVENFKVKEACIFFNIEL